MRLGFFIHIWKLKVTTGDGKKANLSLLIRILELSTGGGEDLGMRLGYIL